MCGSRCFVQDVAQNSATHTWCGTDCGVPLVEPISRVGIWTCCAQGACQSQSDYGSDFLNDGFDMVSHEEACRLATYLNMH